MKRFGPAYPVKAYLRHLYANRFDDACASRYILVVVHPTVEHLRLAATRHSRARFLGDGDFADASGCFQPQQRSSRYDRSKRMWVDTSPAFAGVLRVSRETVTPEIVAHECAHAALHVTRLHDWAQPNQPGEAHLEDMATQEEPFCYLLGSLIPAVQGIVDKALT